jgi:CRP-like cAMP-binding protein
MTKNLAQRDPQVRDCTPRPRCGFLERLSGAERASLRLLGRDINAPAGSRLTFQSDFIERVIIPTSGYAKVTHTSPDGRDSLLGRRVRRTLTALLPCPLGLRACYLVERVDLLSARVYDRTN